MSAFLDSEEVLGRADAFGKRLVPEDVRACLRPPVVECLLRLLAEEEADECTVWLFDCEEEALIPVWNSGPNAGKFVGQHCQSLSRGLMSVVCVTEQAMCENDVHRNTRRDPTLDERLGIQTRRLIAAPLRFFGKTRGAVSCVRLAAKHGEGEPFLPRALARLTEAAGQLRQIIEAP